MGSLWMKIEEGGAAPLMRTISLIVSRYMDIRSSALREGIFLVAIWSASCSSDSNGFNCAHRQGLLFCLCLGAARECSTSPFFLYLLLRQDAFQVSRPKFRPFEAVYRYSNQDNEIEPQKPAETALFTSYSASLTALARKVIRSL